MADRYWVGITGTWNTSSTTVWSTAAPLSLATASCSGTTLTTTGSPALVVGMTVWSSTFVSLGTITGGSGDTWTVSVGGTYASQTMIAATTGASVPTATDDVFFTRPSSTYTATLTGALTCKNFTKTGAVTSFAGTGTLSISGSITLSATIWSASGAITFNSTTTGNTIDTFSASAPGVPPIVFDGVGGGWTLTSAISTTGSITLTNGAFDTAGFSVTATSFNSNNSNTRSLTLGASTLTLSSTTAPWNISSTGLTFSAGTSTIACSGSLTVVTFTGAGQTYGAVSFTSPTLNATASVSITGANTFSTLSITGKSGIGVCPFIFSADQTIGTLTIPVGSATGTGRKFFRSDVIGTTRTLTVSTLTAGATDVDFRDITIAGAAAPISGTRFGDCKGNSGITFDAGKTVYFTSAGAQSWGSFAWALTPGGSSSTANFPLAQDTGVITSTAPTSGIPITVNANWNIGTIDMSARTTNTMTLATGTTAPQIYGNWVNGTGTTLTGTGVVTFAGRGSQTITSAGKTFTQLFNINTPGGAVSLADAFAGSGAGGVILTTAGTFDAAGYNVSLTGATSRFDATGLTRTVAIGSGTWTISGSGLAWATGSATNLTVTGTGTISLTSASAKTFNGGGIQTYPTINQGGVGTLTVTDSNKFANITNTAIGSVLFTGGTTNEFTAFNLNGTSTAARLTLGSTNTTQAILKKPSAWYMGAGSLNSGNNTGLTFSAGGGIDFLAVSYINGQGTAPVVTYQGNFFAFF